MESLKNHLVIVIALEHYNPLSQLRALGENGIRIIKYELHQLVSGQAKFIWWKLRKKLSTY